MTEVIDVPSVSFEHINKLLGKIEYRYTKISETGTHCGAYLGSFMIADGFSACVCVEKFNKELGEKYSKERAEYAVKEKLWELEGWRLFCQLNNISL